MILNQPQVSIKNILPLSQASAFGKIIIVGEHAVVYGSSAVALPINDLPINIVCQTRPLDKKVSYNLNEQPAAVTVNKIINEVFSKLDVNPVSLNININSNLPIGAGLGSSAALINSLIQAVAKLFLIPLNQKQLAFFTNQIETIFHGTPSGLDSTVVSYNKPIFFHSKNDYETFNIKDPVIGNKSYKWKFVLIDSEERCPTITMINEAKPYFTNPKKQRMRRIKFNYFAKKTYESLSQGNIFALGEIINECQKMLEEANIVTNKQKDMIETIQEIGTLGTKITGAGGGGCIFTILHPEKEEAQLKKLNKNFNKKNIFNISI